LGEKDKQSLFRSSDLTRAIDNGNEDVARLIAIDRIINYIRYGKITLHSSYYYQDLGAKIKRVRIGRDEGFLNSDVLEQLISGTFPINIWPLYEAIGFLGRNLRFRDCMDLLSGRNVEAVVIDTMGIEGRKKSILESHGRYHTIGMADLRAVAMDMCPIYSGGYSATDSEAMNIVEVIAQVQVQVQVQAICGDIVKIYSGDCHTTSRVSAGMVFLSHGIVQVYIIC
jgi:hypothetical protein